MNSPVTSCTNCGANITPQDLMGTHCRYCGTILPHQARAAQQAALVNQVLANPQAMQNMANVAAQYGASMQGPYGAPPQQGPYGGPPQQGPYGMPPQQGPYGAPPGMNHGYGYPVQQTMARVQRSIVTWLVVSVVLMLLVFGAIGAALFAR